MLTHKCEINSMFSKEDIPLKFVRIWKGTPCTVHF